MFTGIVEGIGEVVRRAQDRLVIRPPSPFKGTRTGESVSVDGVCLTVEKTDAGLFRFRLLPETCRISTLGGVRPGARVNLERSLRLGDRLGGHLLLGHVDGLGIVAARRPGRPSRQAGRPAGRSLTLELTIPAGLSRFMVAKGPIAVDGVSLTLDSELEKDRIRVHLVAHTLAATTLGQRREGDRVNLEVDLIAKYLWAMLR